MSTIEGRIRQIRKESRLTQTEFGERIGISRSAVTNLETDGRRAKIDDLVIKSICREFHVNENWLRTGDGVPYIAQTDSDMIAEWIGSLAKEKPESFKIRMLKMLSDLPVECWDDLEAKMVELIESRKKPDGD